MKIYVLPIKNENVCRQAYSKMVFISSPSASNTLLCGVDSAKHFAPCLLVKWKIALNPGPGFCSCFGTLESYMFVFQLPVTLLVFIIAEEPPFHFEADAITRVHKHYCSISSQNAREVIQSWLRKDFIIHAKELHNQNPFWSHTFEVLCFPHYSRIHLQSLQLIQGAEGYWTYCTPPFKVLLHFFLIFNSRHISSLLFVSGPKTFIHSHALSNFRKSKRSIPGYNCLSHCRCTGC